MAGALSLVAASCQTTLEPLEEDRSLPLAGDQHLRVATGQDPFLRRTPPPTPLDPTAPDLGVDLPDVGLVADGINLGIFETLTGLSPTFDTVPGLAERWSSPDGRRWTFELRADVTFHDGQPLDAGAVRASLERVALRARRPRGLEPGSVEAAAPLTVQINLAQTNRRLPDQLSDPTLAIVAPGTRAGDGSTPEMTPTGTGPFVFSSYQPGESLEVRANADHWRGAPQLERITMLFGDPTDASRRLAAGEVDLVGGVSPAELAQLSGRVDREVSGPALRSVFLGMNAGGGPDWDRLAERDLRQAISLAIDRDAATAAAWPDDGRPSASIIPPEVLGSAGDRLRPRPMDVGEATALLDAAGWVAGQDGVRMRDGVRLELALQVDGPRDLESAAVAISGQLEAVGIHVRRLPAAADQFDVADVTSSGAFDLLLTDRRALDADPCAMCTLFTLAPGADLRLATALDGGPQAEAHYETAGTVPTRVGAQEQAAALSAVVTDDSVTAIPLSLVPSAWQLSPRVQAFRPGPAPALQAWDRIYLTT